MSSSVKKILVLSLLLIASFSCGSVKDEDRFANLTVNASDVNIEMYWKDDEGKLFKNIKRLRNYIETNGKKLRFAMNGGMYQEDNKPLGLFIQNQKTVTPLNTRDAKTGNFYIKPNGVFYVSTDKKAHLVKTEDFKDDGQVMFATQSGPMLLVDGNISPEFNAGSTSVYLRNGVCVMADNRVIFAISRVEVNFYDFANYFKGLGCKNTLYLDGYVSRMYLPEKNIEDLDGDFGVIIGIAE